MGRFWRCSSGAYGFCVAIAIGSLIALSSLRSSTFYEQAGDETAPLCGLSAVSSMLSLHGISSDLGTIYQHASLDTNGTSLLGCLKALEYSGLPCEPVKYQSVWDLPSRRPAICVVRVRSGLHAVVGVRNGSSVVIVDGPRITSVTTREFDRFGIGVALLASQASGNPVARL